MVGSGEYIIDGETGQRRQENFALSPEASLFPATNIFVRTPIFLDILLAPRALLPNEGGKIA